MKKTGPKVELAALRRSLKKLHDHFVRSHLGLPSLQPPTTDEILDVAAYVVLVHGALENFIESLALWVVGHSVANWTKEKRTTRCTSSLLLYQAIPNDGGPIPTVFDNIRLALDLAKDRVSKTVAENNGITPVHLRNLFLPLGLNVPSDPVLTASLELLVRMRHQWAHQYRFGAAIVIRSAQDVQTTVSDCVTLVQRLSAEAAAMRP